MSNTRINGIEQVEQALRTLEAYGYNTEPVWAEHNEWLRTLDTRPVTAFDVTWATRNIAPSSVEEHFLGHEPELLRAAVAFEDRHFVLTPGQRDTLRERHGLTPARHVILVNVQTFPQTNVIASFTIKSAEHIDVRRRRHVLVEAVVINAAEFFEQGAARDKEREAELAEADTKRVKKGGEPKTAKGRALVYME